VALDVRNVAVHFGGIKAVDGVSLQVLNGSILGILGPNGSGKSTLLAAVSRLVDLTRGSMSFFGHEYDGVKPQEVARRGIARTFQTVRLLEELTVRENVLTGWDTARRRQGTDGRRPRGRRGAANNAAAEAMERCGLTGLERARPSELSYGVQRRVEIARAIAMEPRLLLLDEPTAGMNQTERREVSLLLRQLRSEGLAQLLVEHDVQMMVDTCDRLVAMNSGVTIAEGTPAAVVRNPAVQEAYLGKKWRQHA
jgi:ABC-type branched-subunit amino acid transport system ATPase component